MDRHRIFISGVQEEFAGERAALRAHLRESPFLRGCFDAFLFEDVPAVGRRPEQVYLEELRQSHLYLGLFGDDYGTAAVDGVSPTEREFRYAGELGKPRLIFVKGGADAMRDERMAALIAEAERKLVRGRFDNAGELLAGLDATLAQYMRDNLLMREGDFDAAPCPGAALDDLDPAHLRWFVGRARALRDFPLSEDGDPRELLTHLNLLVRGLPTNAALLLFGKDPQRHLITSEVRCAHFPGSETIKPLLSLQVQQGTVFEMADRAKEYVLGRIDFSVGTRDAGIEIPRAWEIPERVVSEAIVNAVAHRDYASKASVQVMLYRDRLEVLNPGRLPTAWTVEDLLRPHESASENSRIAHAMYLAGYIERLGGGTIDMLKRCAKAGLPPPEFAVSGSGFSVRIRRPERERWVPPSAASASRLEARISLLEAKVLGLLNECERSKAELSRALGQRQASGPLHKAVRRLLDEGWIERTVPDKPASRLQKYRRARAGGPDY